MRTYLFIAILFLLLPISLKGQNDTLVKDIMDKTIEKLKSIKSIEYDINVKCQRVGDLDTSNLDAFCYFEVQNKDSLLHRHFYAKEEQTSYMYDGIMGYKKRDALAETITYSSKELDPFFGMEYFLDSWLIGFVLETAVLVHQDFVAGNEIKKKYLGTKIINNKKCHVLNYSFTDEAEHTGWSVSLFINTKDNLPIKTITIIGEMGLDQYTEKTISNYKINCGRNYIQNFKNNINKIVPIQDLRIKDTTTSQVFTLVAQSGYSKLGTMTTINGEKIDSVDLKNKIVLLDFWYMSSCSPCLKSIPAIKKIYSKYKDDIIILGINPFDSKNSISEVIG